MLRRLVPAVLIVVVALALVIFAWPQLFGLQHAVLVAQVVALRGLAAAGALVAALLLFALAAAIRPIRRFTAAMGVLLLAFVAINAAVIGTRGVNSADASAAPEASDAADSLTVLAWNTLGDTPSADTVAQLAIDESADVVSLPETTEDFAIEVAERMGAAGLPMWVHHLSLDDEYDAKQTALLTSVDLGNYSIDTSRGTTPIVPTVIATPDDGDGPTIIAAHPVAPIPEYLAQWRADLEFVSGLCAGDDIIMAGDFNSTLDHWAALGNGTDGQLGDCTDAASTTGSAAVGTWPVALPALLGSPIDHVVSSGWTATAFRVIVELDDAGSDHRPVVATLTRNRP